MIEQNQKREDPELGMTLRDYFAGLAMQGLCVNVGRNGFRNADPHNLTEQSYKLADAMLKERAKP